MSAAPAVAHEVDAWGLVASPLRRSFEHALEDETVRLGETLPWVREALARALGTEGHAAGRRWRPLLTLVAAEACGGDHRDALSAAISVELTHTASLLLDDLPCMDDAALRRGELTAHRRLGSAGAILLAVGLLGRAAECAGALPRNGDAVAASWGRTIGLTGMAGGQAVDLAHAGKGAARASARRLLRRKTTVLAAFAAESGARAVGATEPQVVALARFGRDLGWAYQLADDACDAAEDSAAGREASGCAPVRQARFLLNRAARALHASALPDHGAAALLACGRAVVGSMLDDVS
jgi:geranylgeranyl pyrophosphate synthase